MRLVELQKEEGAGHGAQEAPEPGLFRGSRGLGSQGRARVLGCPFGVFGVGFGGPSSKGLGMGAWGAEV